MNLSRRDLIRGGCMGSAALAMGAKLPLISSAIAQTDPSFNDYRALVCVMLHGGNDAFNMLVPLGGSSAAYSYDKYSAVRGDELAVRDNRLPSVGAFFDSAGNLTSNPYRYNATGQASDPESYRHGVFPLTDQDAGLNALVPEIAKLFEEKKVSILSNIGNLITPISKSEYIDKSKPRPPFLMAHNHQRRAFHTGWGDNLVANGWAGRIADIWQEANVNLAVPGFDMNISYSGLPRMLIGGSTSPLVLSPGDPPDYSGLDANNHKQMPRWEHYNALINNATHRGSMRKLYAALQRNSMDAVEGLKEKWQTIHFPAGMTNAYGNNAIFTAPEQADTELETDVKGKLFSQLESVARMIKLVSNDPAAFQLYRQIFYVSLGGFDNHSNQSKKHPTLLRGLSLALYDFQRAMDAMGLSQKVTLFTASDFGRTVRSNGDGTDHAWGTHHMVMGGAVENGSGGGGQIIGRLPDVSLGSDDDFSGTGRLIPDLAQDQFSATLAKWLGLNDGSMSAIFPNLQHFQTIPGNVYSSYIPELLV